VSDLIIQGRRLGAAELQFIRELRQSQPQWSRAELSRQVAEQWQWRNGVGQLKDMAARTLLLKLHRRGLIELPAPQRRNGNARRRAVPLGAEPPSEELALALPAGESERPAGPSLAALAPLTLTGAATAAERREVRSLLAQYHYLGYGGPVGENVQQLVHDARGRAVAVMVWGAAAWKCAPREAFIGWSSAQRRARLGLVANQQRFLVLPWGRVPHLASHVLARATRRLARDWRERYGHPVVLAESFVETGRFAGTVYRAANWVHVGETQGRSRQDRTRTLQVPVKAVWLLPLSARFRAVLTAPLAPSEAGGTPCC
jgi:hypothetical protein